MEQLFLVIGRDISEIDPQQLSEDLRTLDKINKKLQEARNSIVDPQEKARQWHDDLKLDEIESDNQEGTSTDV